MLDCAIIGGGPAGLTAAVYLGRFGLKARLFDGGASRAAIIPCTRNAVGFPDGISGRDLLTRMREHAARYGVATEAATVDGLATVGDGFRLNVESASVAARTVLLATGVVNHRPPMPDDLHDRAVAAGRLRYCPVCDGFEVTDRRVAVIGTGDHGTREALFLRSYTRDVTLVARDGAPDLDPECEARLDAAGVRRLGGPCRNWTLTDDDIAFETTDGRVEADSVYPALGSAIRSELAIGVGARASDGGCLEVDDHQRTSVAGLYAAGDVVRGLDQISHATGEAGVAATTIRNELDERRPLWR